MKLVKNDLKKMFFAVLLVMVFLIALGCTQQETILDDTLPVQGEPQEQLVDPEGFDDPFGGGVYDEPVGEVAAIVNGEEITFQEIQELQSDLMQQGQEVSDEIILEHLIDQLVLYQKAIEEGTVFTTEEVELEIESQLAMQGMTLGDYKQQLETVNVSYDKEIERIKKDLLSQRYLYSLVDLDSIEIQDEEIELVYEDYVSQAEQSGEEEIISLEELRPQITTMLQQEKASEIQNELIQEIRSNASIEYK
jgi:parvulin-like peptidyl-prolyl isomerase